ncbi:polysaccharide deacetylase family protein [Chryseobacterium sp.]|jgi:hypothetical protein|uniref:polysaccharide deacetylase family protein n=1 Tax=Chryseobacterium sp. TaxID=1871047 RepID=UPI00284AEB80|nr:polysaccharide deacetylase family protein [Chryseobacterium sp.]MDR3026067.1 polysaccharide deacetylase family protein [Chryseobacterium sp.]
MSDQIIQAPFVKFVPTTEIPTTQDPLEGHILNYNSQGILTFTPIDTLKEMVISGTKEATPTSSPTPWVPGDPDLFEKWDVRTPGTYTNFKDASNNPIIVTEDDLAEKIAQIWVTNGVSKLELVDLGVNYEELNKKIDTTSLGLNQTLPDVNYASVLSNSDINDTNIWANGFLASNGSVDTTNPAFRYSKNYYPISQGKYEVRLSAYGTASMLIYDAKGVIIQVIQKGSSSIGVYTKTVDIVKNAVSYRLSHYTTNVNVSTIYVTSKEYIYQPTDKYFLPTESQRYNDLVALSTSPNILKTGDVLPFSQSDFELGYLHTNGRMIAATYDPTSGLGVVTNFNKRKKLYKGGTYTVGTNITGNYSIGIFDKYERLIKTWNLASPEVTTSKGVQWLTIDLTTAVDNVFLVVSLIDYNPATKPTEHAAQWAKLSLASASTFAINFNNDQVGNEEYDLYEKFDGQIRSIKDIEIYNSALELQPNSVAGGKNLIYKIPIKPQNGKTRIKFEVKFDANVNDQTLTSYAFAQLFGGTALRNLVMQPKAIQQTTRNQNYFAPTTIAMLYNGNSVGSVDTTQYKKGYFGDIVFSIRYKGDVVNNATIRNMYLTIDATSFKITNEDSGVILYQYFYDNITTCKALFDDIKANSNFDLKLNSTLNILVKDLLKLPKIYLSGETTKSDTTKFWDSGYVPIRKAISEEWHIVEMLIDGGKFSFSINGDSSVDSNSSTNPFGSKTMFLYLGGLSTGFEIPNQIRNLHVTVNGHGEAYNLRYRSTLDSVSSATFYQKYISQYSPQLLIFEGHGLENKQEGEALTDDLATSTDRLNYLFGLMDSKGYKYVTVSQIVEWKKNKTPLPVKCFTVIFDDWRWQNYLQNDNRKVFHKYNIKPAPAVITDWVNTEVVTYKGITFNNRNIWSNANNDGWEAHSHTRNHRRISDDKPSEMINELEMDQLSCVVAGCKSEILTYPYGAINQNFLSQIPLSGFKIGIQIVTGNFPTLATSDYYLGRIEIGVRESLDRLIGNIY